MIPGLALIYESVNGVIYARYRDPPHNTIPRRVIGEYSATDSTALRNLFSYSDYQDMMRIAETNETLKTQMKKLLDIYYILKDER